MPFSAHPRNHWGDDFIEDLLFQRAIAERARCEGAHAAGVRALIAVVDALVILRGAKGKHALAVTQHEVGQLRSLQTFLDHEPVTRRAESPLAHHRRHGGVGRGRVGSHDDALAGRETVGLEHHRERKAAGPQHIDGFVGRRAGLPRRRRHAVTGHEPLCERLAALECRGGACRSKNWEAEPRKAIDDAAARGAIRDR